MKLTKENIEYLLWIGENEEDIRQIEICCNKVELYDETEKKVLIPEEAIAKLGINNYLAACGRAAFHNTTQCLYGENFQYAISFDYSWYVRWANGHYNG